MVWIELGLAGALFVVGIVYFVIAQGIFRREGRDGIGQPVRWLSWGVAALGIGSFILFGFMLFQGWLSLESRLVTLGLWLAGIGLALGLLFTAIGMRIGRIAPPSCLSASMFDGYRQHRYANEFLLLAAVLLVVLYIS